LKACVGGFCFEVVGFFDERLRCPTSHYKKKAKAFFSRLFY